MNNTSTFCWQPPLLYHKIKWLLFDLEKVNLPSRLLFLRFRNNVLTLKSAQLMYCMLMLLMCHMHTATASSESRQSNYYSYANEPVTQSNDLKQVFSFPYFAWKRDASTDEQFEGSSVLLWMEYWMDLKDTGPGAPDPSGPWAEPLINATVNISSPQLSQMTTKRHRTTPKRWKMTSEKHKRTTRKHKAASKKRKTTTKRHKKRKLRCKTQKKC